METLWLDGRPQRFKALVDTVFTRREALGGSRTDLARAYSSAVWAYRCIKLRADALASVPLQLVDGDGTLIEAHPLLRLLRDVNPETMNLGDLLRATEAAYNIWGSAFWWLPPGRTPRAIYWLNPQTVEVLRDPQRGVLGYRQGTREIPPEQVIAFRNFDPLDDLGGLSPLEVVLNEVNAERNAGQFVANFFANDARPAGLLTTDKPLVESELDRVMTWWERLFKGVGQRWRTGIVGGGLRWQPITTPVDELALADLRAEDRRAICAAFGVPPGLAGAWEATTYATAREQKASFYEDTMIPQMGYIAEVLNWALLPRYPDLTLRGARLAWDIDSIAALGESTTAKVERLTRLHEAGIITREEVRTQLGLPPRPAITGKSDEDMLADLRRWERFAVRRIKEGRRLRRFRSEVIPADLHAQVEEALADALTVEEVRGLFAAVRDSVEEDA